MFITHHDGVGQVAIGLILQAYSTELGSHIALRSGLVQGSSPDLTQLGRHKERQHTLRRTRHQAQTDDTVLKWPISTTLYYASGRTSLGVTEIRFHITVYESIKGQTKVTLFEFMRS